MRVYKRGKNWYFDITDSGGARVRRSTGTSDKREAEAVAARLIAEAHHQKWHGSKPRRKFDDVMSKFLDFSEKHKKSFYDDVYRTRTLKKFFGGMYIDEINSAQITTYQSKRLNEKNKSGGYISNSTVNREVILLGAAIEYCNKNFDWGLPNNARSRKLREPQGRARWITQGEADKLIMEAKKSSSVYLPEFIILALNTGCRRSELLGLTWFQVDINNNLIVLEKTKSGRRRSIPINKNAKMALLRLKNWQELSGVNTEFVITDGNGNKFNSVRKGFINACNRAGIKNFRVHDMRHTFASWLVMDGVPLYEVSKLLGHASITTTEIYAHLAPDRLRVAVNTLNRDGDEIEQCLSSRS